MNIFLCSFLVEFQLQMSYNSILGKQRHLKVFLLKSSGSNAPSIVSLSDYLTSTTLVVSNSLELLFYEYNKKKNPSQPRESTSNQCGRRTSNTSPPNTSYTYSNNRSLHNESTKIEFLDNIFLCFEEKFNGLDTISTLQMLTFFFFLLNFFFFGGKSLFIS